MCHDYKDVWKAHELAQSKGLKTKVGLTFRYAPAVMYMFDLIREGFIGRPFVFNGYEQARLAAEVRGYLVQLENIGILSTQQRELVIDRLLALEAEEIDIEQVKWVVLMVLFSQPGQEQAYQRMEDLVFEGQSDALH